MHKRKRTFLILLLLSLVPLSLRYITSFCTSSEYGLVNIKPSQGNSSVETEKESTDGPQENPSSSEEERYILHSPNLCMQGSSQIKLDYLVLVFSAPSNFDQRNAIRETWASELRERSNSRTAFLLARTEDTNLQHVIESESYLHSDIVQGTYIDHYRNQSLKVKMMIRWALQYCPNVSFLCKSDDDIFVNVPYFLKAMKNKFTDAIHGYLFKNLKPVRETSSKWHVSLEHYNGTIYPLFVGGASYVLGGSIVRRLCEALEQVPFFWLEDVFLTGFVAQKAGVDRLYNEAFTTNATTSVCDAQKRATSHYITPRNMRIYWYQLRYSLVKCKNT